MTSSGQFDPMSVMTSSGQFDTPPLSVMTSSASNDERDCGADDERSSSVSLDLDQSAGDLDQYGADFDQSGGNRDESGGDLPPIDLPPFVAPAARGMERELRDAAVGGRVGVGARGGVNVVGEGLHDGRAVTAISEWKVCKHYSHASIVLEIDSAAYR